MALDCSHCSFRNPDHAQFCSRCKAPLTQILYTLAPGSHLAQGQYRIDAVLGEGAFGITYKGMNLATNQPVAIKELFPYGSIRQGQSFLLPNNLDDQGFAELRQQFTVEGNCLIQLNNPHIVKGLARFEENGTLYIVMEFVEGRTLHRLVKARGPLEDKVVLHYLRQIGQALANVHLQGFVHRATLSLSCELTHNLVLQAIKQNDEMMSALGSRRRERGLANIRKLLHLLYKY